MMGKQLFGFVFLCLLVVTEEADPCDKDGHRRIPNEGFRYVYYKISSTETPNHDSRLLESWYYVGNTKMPENPPDLYSCGTKFPIWLNGTHPNGTKELSCPKCACMASLTNMCSKRFDIKIKRCPKGFYLYHLKRTDDHEEGYCFGIGINASATKYVPPKPSVRFPLHTVFIKNLPVSEVQFHCDFKMSTTESLLYRVSWWRENDLWHTTPYADDSKKDNLLLTENLFQQKGFRMGEKISCTVRAFTVKDGPPGKSSARSDAEFLGIKILTPSLSFQKGETSASKRTIKLKPTVPVGCYATDTCTLWLTVYTNVSAGSANCNGLVLEKTSCGATIASKTYAKELHIPVARDETGQYQTKPDVYYVHLRTGAKIENQLWKNYQLPPIKVVITPKPLNTSTYEGKTCSAVPDPHYQTFEGNFYDNHYKGVFILYQHLTFDAEIQIKQQKCGNNGDIDIMCPCGVAVRAGQDSYVISLCDETIEFGYKTCGDHVVIAKRIDATHYKIFLPYATYVDVTVSGNWMSVNVIPSTFDEKLKSMGLCGRLGADCSNDFHYKDGSTITKNNCLVNILYDYKHQPVEFIKAWQVTTPTKIMFHPNFNSSNAAKPWSRKVCGCERKTDSSGAEVFTRAVQCQENTLATCTNGHGKVINGECIDPKRHRRSLRGNHVIPTVFIPNSISMYRKKRAPSENKTWTQSDAEDYCTKYMKRSPIFDMCSERVPNVNVNFSLGACASDIMLTGGVDYAAVSVEGMRGSCLSELERNTTLRKTNGSEPSIAQLIEERACPNNCSEAGTCEKGKCYCDDGFGSSDCSLDMSKAPTLSGLLDHGLCDEQQLKCDHAYMFGHIFSDSANLTCKLEEFTISMEGTRSTRSTHYLPGEFETLVEIICPLHIVRHKRSLSSGDQSEFVFGYSISVSNDGYHFQKDGHDLFVYDSACQKVANKSGQLHFALKDGYCFLENKCVPNGKRSVSNKCFICNTNTSSTAWSSDISRPGCASVSPPKIDTGSKKTDTGSKKIDTDSKKPKYLWTIGVVGGVILGAVVAGVVFVKLTKKRVKKVGDSTLIHTSNTAVDGHAT